MVCHAPCERVQDLEGEEKRRGNEAVLRGNEEGVQDQDSRKEIPGLDLCYGDGEANEWTDPVCGTSRCLG